MISTASLAEGTAKVPLPAIIDQVAKNDPEKVFLVLPERNDTTEGSRTITYGQFNQAVDRTVLWLEQTLGCQASQPVVAFMSRPYDPRYLIFLIAGMKTGLAFLLPSPRNSVENHLHIFRKVSCDIIVSDMDLRDLLKESGCRIYKPPQLKDLLHGDAVEHRPFNQTYEECWDKPACVLHSSGSTGPPKPVVWSHGWLMALNGSMAYPRWNGAEQGFGLYRRRPNMTHLLTLPLFHAAGVIHGLLLNVFNGAPHVVPPESMPPTAENVATLLRTHQPDSILTSPSILEEMLEEKDILQNLRSMEFVAYGGAPMSQSAGQKLTAQGVYLYPSIGSTETGPFPQFLSTRRDAFNYQRWPDHFPGIHWRDVGGGLYEMVFIRCELDMPIFHVFPDLEEYATKDLYRRHPEMPDHYLYANRIDDVIVLSNGEKLVPLPMEDAIRRATGVTGVLVVGFGHFSTAVLIEFDTYKASTWTEKEKLDYVSPFIDEANSIAPGHARLSKDQVIFTPATKPMIRSGKGSLIRGQNLKLYATEIEHVYANENLSNQDGLDPEEMEESKIQNLIFKILKPYMKNESEMGLDDDLFETVGLDSAKVLEVTRQIRRQFRFGEGRDTRLITSKLIYNNPTVGRLSSALASFTNDAVTDDIEDHLTAMKNMLQELVAEMTADSRPETPPSVTSGSSAQSSASHSPFDSLLQSRRTSATSIDRYEEDWAQDIGAILDEKREERQLHHQPRKSLGDVVILTGSTGSLGSYILDLLINDPQTTQIFALNRGSDSEARQFQSNSSKGLSTDFSKVTFLQPDLSQTSFGLPDEQYNILLASVSTIIHNAWPVNFNQSLESFTPQIAGVQRLVQFSNVSQRQAHIIFVSSIGTTAGWAEIQPNGGGAPEELIEDFRAPLAQGYSESKYISELLLAEAAKLAVRSTVCRVGQIAGPVEAAKGQWNRHEWLPSLIISSAYMKLLPETLGLAEANVDWTPVDLVAKMIVELGITDCSQAQNEPPVANFFNLANPTPVYWKELLPSIQAYMPTGTRVVPFTEWLQQLRQSGDTERPDLDRNPALKLMEYWNAMANGSHPSGMKTEKTAQASKTMKTLSSVNEVWMSRWMEQWGFTVTSH